MRSSDANRRTCTSFALGVIIRPPPHKVLEPWPVAADPPTSSCLLLLEEGWCAGSRSKWRQQITAHPGRSNPFLVYRALPIRPVRGYSCMCTSRELPTLAASPNPPSLRSSSTSHAPKRRHAVPLPTPPFSITSASRSPRRTLAAAFFPFPPGLAQPLPVVH